MVLVVSVMEEEDTELWFDMATDDAVFWFDVGKSMTEEDAELWFNMGIAAPMGIAALVVSPELWFKADSTVYPKLVFHTGNIVYPSL